MFCRNAATKQFMHPTKPFYRLDANIRKLSAGTNEPNEARRTAQKRSNRGRAMINSATFKLTARRAAAFYALAIGVVALSGPATAAPLQLFPFFMTPPVEQT